MQLTLTLLTLIGCATVAVHQMHLTKIESRRLKMVKAGTWSTFLKSRNAQRISLDRVFAKCVCSPFKILLDTSSWNRMIADISCGQVNASCTDMADPYCMFTLLCVELCANQACCDGALVDACAGKNTFMSSKSTSYFANGEILIMEFGTSSAEGFLGLDTVRFGGIGIDQLVIPKTVFGQATSIGDLFAKSIAEDDVTPPFTNAINQGIVDQPIFTVYLEHVGDRDNVYGGTFTYVGLDTTHCGPVIAFQPLSSATFYKFTNGVHFDFGVQNESTLLRKNAIKTPGKPEENPEKWIVEANFQEFAPRIGAVTSGSFRSTVSSQAISDTETSRLAAFTRIANGIANAYGATYDADNDAYYIGCMATPKISIAIGENIYTITSKNLVIPTGLKDGRCLLAIIGIQTSAFGPDWLLGAPFIREYCNVYDVGQQRIGFARSLQKS